MYLRSLVPASALLSLSSTPVSAEMACNNSPSLCNRAYNNITHLGAHDSPFLRNQQTSFSTSGNHYYNTTTQLDAGVRLLSAQVHKVTVNGADAWHLCHSSCDLLDAGTLQNWLSEIKSWMDGNPNDVVTVLIVNSDNAAASVLGPMFTGSGIDKYAYVPPSTTTIPQKWPTLSNLIANNTRLMTFVASIGSGSSDYPFLMDEFTFIFENDYNNVSPTNYSCTPNRPTNLGTPAAALSSGRMFLMNHFLYQLNAFFQAPNDTYAAVTNAESGTGSLGESIQKCTTTYSKPPTFVLVDWFNVGPAIASVDTANRISDVTGRKAVSTDALTKGSGAGSSNSAGAGGRPAGLVALVLGCALVLGLSM